MKTRLLYIATAAILIIPFLVGCSKQSGTNTSDEEIQRFRELGLLNERYDSAKQASKIAGFKVIEPSYIPEGFEKPYFFVFKSGARLPEELKPGFETTEVWSTYRHEQDHQISIHLQQSDIKIHLGEGEPTELCGHPAERAFVKGDPQKAVPYDTLAFSWDVNGNYFVLNGVLAGSVTEAELVKMACSIKP